MPNWVHLRLTGQDTCRLSYCCYYCYCCFCVEIVAGCINIGYYKIRTATSSGHTGDNIFIVIYKRNNNKGSGANNKHYTISEWLLQLLYTLLLLLLLLFCIGSNGIDRQKWGWGVPCREKAVNSDYVRGPWVRSCEPFVLINRTTIYKQAWGDSEG